MGDMPTSSKTYTIPQEMQALYYSKPQVFDVRTVSVPQCGDDEVMIKVGACGVCGTDQHIHNGEFISKFPLIPGHEVVGEIVQVGKNVHDFKPGMRAVADVGVTCGKCFYCRRGQELLCENFASKGVTTDGGFAEYVCYDQSKVYQIHNLTDIEATLLEPAACALHGLDKIRPPVGSEVLLMGAGPTGLILSQLLKQNGAVKVVLAANKGMKMDIAKQINAADVYIELDRKEPEAQWEQLKKDHPYGFDIVVEATGVEKLANDAINYVRRGGTLMIYGVYENSALVHWPPGKIFGDEITIVGSFSQTYCFPRALAYLDSGKVNVKGMVTDVYTIAQYQDALDKMASRQCLKIAIKPTHLA
ncbi:GroES-like protein [Dacryopinax primogenitus]|uniref:GroES-like protein n=1 Tax=Dacryopinax primogenitus (strain DJM 731) TaxID=1858805 RepID=M5FUR7_DACPD|nr:GroES-like protein [Dacryopinax primogenitus]EJT99239.1 GroES-like protein [Dacryopinax primogenitus]